MKQLDISALERQMREAVLDYGRASGAALADYAKKNAPYRDSAVKDGIFGGAVSRDDAVDVYVGGDAARLPALELTGEMKNAVLWPTVLAMAPGIVSGMRNLFSRCQ